MNRLSVCCAPVLLAVIAGQSGIAHAGPELPPGVWVDITPPTVQKGAPETCLGQGVAVDPQNPSTIYWGSTPYEEELGGMWKSVDGGSNWERVASVEPAWDGASDHLDMPLHMRIDPNNTDRLYAGDGVRGSSQGFFISTDGGMTFEKAPGWNAALEAADISTEDVYDVAVNPTNFDHALVSFHSAWGWTDTKWNENSGILETRDAGRTFIVHEPAGEWGSGHSIKFLYEPEMEIGDAFTWLLGTQESGYWRTDDAGATWTKVSDNSITHGGSTIYYAKTGWLYTSGVDSTMRSNDNGVTWEEVGPGGSWSVHGDGDFLWSGGGFDYNGPFMVSPEDDGENWREFSDQNFLEGPYEMAYDQYYGILYSSNWTTGLFALKANAGSGAIPPITTPRPVPGAGAGGMATTGGATGSGGTTGVGEGGAPSSGGTAGRAGSGSGRGGAAGEAGAAGANVSAAKTHSDSGCGCRTAYAGSSAGSAFVALLISGLSLRRVRRRRVA